MTNESDLNQTDQENQTPQMGVGRYLAWIVVIGLLTVVGVQLKKAQEGILSLNEPAPRFVLTTFEDTQITPADMEGKVVLVNIWASWCIPCKDEADELQAAWEIYEPRGDVLFLGVDYADTDREALRFIEEEGITYINGPDLGTKIYLAFRVTGVPETFIIDKNYNLRHVRIGAFKSVDEIIAQIDPLLEE